MTSKISSNPINDSREHRFALGLYRLKRADDRATLARLRRGLGKPLSASMDSYPFLGRYLEAGRHFGGRTGFQDSRFDDIIHTVAGLFALHPVYPQGAKADLDQEDHEGTASRSDWTGDEAIGVPDAPTPSEAGQNLHDNVSGRSFLWSLRQLPRADEIPGMERRILAMLDADFGQLDVHLRHAVGLLRTAERPIPVDWERLVRDLIYWDHREHFIQRRWASDWWRHYSLEEVAAAPADMSDAASEAGTP